MLPSRPRPPPSARVHLPGCTGDAPGLVGRSRRFCHRPCRRQGQQRVGRHRRPDGHSNQTFTLGSYTFDIGTLVGELDGTFFKVGSNYSGVTPTGGELALFYWDSDACNNLGFVQAIVTGTPAVSPVPEPANLALQGLALGAFALTSRRKV